MKNKEYYKEEIFDIACTGNSISIVNDIPTKCSVDNDCDSCDLYLQSKINNCDDCRKTLQKWLEQEHKEIDWNEVEKDTPILVRCYEYDEWQKRHFSYYENGCVFAFNNGTTSWTADNKSYISEWKYAKLAKERK